MTFLLAIESLPFFPPDLYCWEACNRGPFLFGLQPLGRGISLLQRGRWALSLTWARKLPLLLYLPHSGDCRTTRRIPPLASPQHMVKTAGFTSSTIGIPPCFPVKFPCYHMQREEVFVPDYVGQACFPWPMFLLLPYGASRQDNVPLDTDRLPGDEAEGAYAPVGYRGFLEADGFCGRRERHIATRSISPPGQFWEAWKVGEGFDGIPLQGEDFLDFLFLLGLV